MYVLRVRLYKLLKKDSKWNWSTECQSVFEEMKIILTSDMSLKHSDPKKGIIGAGDASNLGVETVI